MSNKLLVKYTSLPKQVKASLWFLLCGFLQKGINVITTPIITRLLTVEEYGKYSVFNSWLGIIGVFVTLRIGYGIYTQSIIKFKEDSSKITSSLQGLTLVMTLLWTVVYLLFRDFFNSIFSLTTVQMLAMLAMIWATAVFDFWSAEQRVKLTYKSLVAVTVLSTLAKPVVGIVFVILAEDNTTAYILGLTLVEIIFFAGLFVLHIKRGKVFFSKRYWKYALMLCIPLVPHYLSQTVLTSSDRIMIEKLCNTSDAGIYNLAYSISMIMTLFNTALSQTINPWIYSKIRDKKVMDIAKIAYVCLILVAVVNIVLIIFAPEVIAIFAPEEYYDAIWTIPPIAMSVLFIFAYGLFADFEFYFEKTGYISLATGIAALLNIALNYVFIKLFGYYAAGYTTLVCYILYTIGHYYFMTRICNKNLDGVKPYSIKILLTITITFLIIGFAIMFTYNMPILRYSLAGCMFLAVIIFRKKIISSVKQVLAVKNNNS